MAGRGPDELIDAAFRAAEDGDCPRTSRLLDDAESGGKAVAKWRAQLLKDCKIARSTGGLGGFAKGSRPARACVSKWIREQRKSRRPLKQKVAIAYSKCRIRGFRLKRRK